MKTRRALSLSVCLSMSLIAPAQLAHAGPKLIRTNSFDDLMRRGQNLLADIREVKCYKDEAEYKHWSELLQAYRSAISDLQKTTYPYHKHEPLDSHIERLDTIADKIFSNLIDLKPCPPPDPSKGVLHGPGWDEPGQTTPSPKADTAPEHSSLMPSPDNPLAHNDWSVGGDYANFNPKTGSSADQWGLGVHGQAMIGQNVAIDVSGGYNNVSGNGMSLSNWTAAASAVWYFPAGRVGPVVGYQNNSESGFHSDTWNYGGFGEYFWPSFTLGGKAGGFNTDSSFSNSSGYYAGGSLTGYVNPNFSVAGSVDHTHFSPFGGSGETDWSITTNWRPWSGTPVTIWGGYTYSDFSPGSFSVNVISVGVRFDLSNGLTLIDSDRGGVVINQAAFAPLSLKF